MLSKLLTRKELGEKLAIDSSNISQLVARGMPVVGKKFDLDAVIDWRDDQTKDQLSELKIGQAYLNEEIVKMFFCATQGGMRRSHKTNTLVLFSDHTGKKIYNDVWEGDILKYTGTGRIGDQVLKGNQNKTLANANNNYVHVHLFEMFEPTQHTYSGEVFLSGEVYQTQELDEIGNNRLVYKFPISLVK